MRVMKVLAIVLASVVAVMVVAGLLLVSLFDPNDYKSYATSFVENRTGRTLEIADDVKLSFFPWLAIEAGGVTLGNAENFTDQPFATIASVSARVKLMPLLSRQIEVGRVDIEGIELNLGRDEQMHGNWEDLTGAAAESADGSAAESPASGGSLEIEGIRIKDGRVNWRENRTDLRFVVSNLSLETGSINPSAPIALTLGFTVLDAISRIQLELNSRVVAAMDDNGLSASDFSADFRVVGPESDERASGNVAFRELTVSNSGAIEVVGTAANTRVVSPTWPNGMQLDIGWENARFDPGTQTMSLTGLVTNAGGVEATWQVHGESLVDAPQLSGSVDVAANSAADVLGLLAVDAPAGVDPAALGSVRASANFTTDVNALKISATNVAAQVLGMQISGAVDVDANILRANVTIPRFTPDATLISLLEGFAPDSMDVRSLGALAYRSNIEADLDSGRATLRAINAELLGGTLSGELALVPSANGPSLSGAIKTSRFPSSAIAGMIRGYLPENIDASQLGVLAIDTRFNYNAANDSAALNPLTLEAFGLNISGNAALTSVSKMPNVTGEAHLQSFAPRELLQRFGQPVPQTSDPTVLQKATVDARFNVNADRGQFDNLVVNLDDSRIAGSLTVSDFANPSYRFDLSADRIDVDRYLPPPADQAAEGERVAGDIELSPEPLNALRIQGRASVGDLKLTNLRFQQVSTGIAIGGGEATLDSASAKLYGGEFNGAMHVDTNGQLPTMKLQGRAAGLQLKPLIEALVGDANFSGTGSFDIDLTGRGKTITENLTGAAGTMGFALRDGAIEGFNLGHVLCSAYNVLQQLPGPADAPKETRYQLIQANATVSNGVATSQELLARSPFMDVTGSGTLTLADQKLDYNLSAKLTNSITIARCESMDRLIGGSIPFTIRGTVTDADIRPDFGKIIQDRVRDEVRDRLQDRLQDRLRDLF